MNLIEEVQGIDSELGRKLSAISGTDVGNGVYDSIEQTGIHELCYRPIQKEYRKGIAGMNRITVKDASKRMGVSEQFLRASIRDGKFPWGTATKITDTSRWTYYINEQAFDRYMRGE